MNSMNDEKNEKKEAMKEFLKNKFDLDKMTITDHSHFHCFKGDYELIVQNEYKVIILHKGKELLYSTRSDKEDFLNVCLYVIENNLTSRIAIVKSKFKEIDKRISTFLENEQTLEDGNIYYSVDEDQLEGKEFVKFKFRFGPSVEYSYYFNSNIVRRVYSWTTYNLDRRSSETIYDISNEKGRDDLYESLKPYFVKRKPVVETIDFKKSDSK
jgi:hypothetical protein